MFLDDCDYYCNNAYCHAVTMPVVLYLLYACVLVNNIRLGAQSVNVSVQRLYRYRTEGAAPSVWWCKKDVRATEEILNLLWSKGAKRVETFESYHLQP